MKLIAVYCWDETRCSRTYKFRRRSELRWSQADINETLTQDTSVDWMRATEVN